MDLMLMNKAQRQDYYYVRRCMMGMYDISIYSKRGRRCRRMLTKILDRWLEEGHIEDYRLSRGTPVEDAFGVHGQDVTLMIEIFTGYKKQKRSGVERVSWEPKLPDLPPPDHRPLDHSFQGKMHPYSYTAIQKEIEEERKHRQWRAEKAGVQFKIGVKEKRPKKAFPIKKYLGKEVLF